MFENFGLVSVVRFFLSDNCWSDEAEIPVLIYAIPQKESGNPGSKKYEL